MTVTEAMLRGVQPVERGWILRILADYVCGEVDATTVRNALSQLGVPIDRQHYRAHLDYLAERGYIRLTRLEIGGIANTTLAITADGRDVRSGARTDLGVLATVGD